MSASFLSDLIITKVISASTIYTEAGAKVKKRNRSAWAFVLKFEGETIYNQNNETLISNSENIIVLPQNSNYEWLCTKSGHCIIIDFECTSKSTHLHSLKTSPPERILKLFKAIEFCLTLRKELHQQEAIKILYEIILLSSVEHDKRYQHKNKQNKILPAIKYIAKNYHKKLNNDELAGLCGLSTVYFRKLFTETIGISPGNYIHNLRINKAKEMFASDYTSITEIALSLGYSDIYDFSRVFKKVAGISPSMYKKMQKARQGSF